MRLVLSTKLTNNFIGLKLKDFTFSQTGATSVIWEKNWKKNWTVKPIKILISLIKTDDIKIIKL